MSTSYLRETVADIEVQTVADNADIRVAICSLLQGFKYEVMRRAIEYDESTDGTTLLQNCAYGSLKRAIEYGESTGTETPKSTLTRATQDPDAKSGTQSRLRRVRRPIEHVSKPADLGWKIWWKSFVSALPNDSKIKIQKALEEFGVTDLDCPKSSEWTSFSWYHSQWVWYFLWLVVRPIMFDRIRSTRKFSLFDEFTVLDKGLESYELVLEQVQSTVRKCKIMKDRDEAVQLFSSAMTNYREAFKSLVDKINVSELLNPDLFQIWAECPAYKDMSGVMETFENDLKIYLTAPGGPWL